MSEDDRDYWYLLDGWDLRLIRGFDVYGYNAKGELVLLPTANMYDVEKDGYQITAEDAERLKDKTIARRKERLGLKG